MTKFTAFTFIFFLGALGVSFAILQEITFYSEFNFEGDSITFKSHKPNFTGYEAVKSSKTFCVSGLWVGYQRTNYGEGGAILFEGDGDSRGCLNSSAAPLVNSGRHIGSLDTSTAAITLYSGNFTKEQEYHITSMAALNLPFLPRSYVTSGKTNWTLYTGPNFDGNSTCIRAGPHDLSYDMSYPFECRSLVQGCGLKAAQNILKFKN